MIENKMIKHEEIGGGYSGKKKIIIDTCQFSEDEFETMAFYNNGEEIGCMTAKTLERAIEHFSEMVNLYAGDLQKALYNANLKEGEKYTLVYLSDFGFPVCQKITFKGMHFCTYAQHFDCVEMIFKPFRKRNFDKKIFRNQSIMIFKGWQELKETDTYNVLEDNGITKTRMSKYSCFDSRYIDDIEQILQNPVCIYKDYKTGVNGKIYA